MSVVTTDSHLENEPLEIQTKISEIGSEVGTLVPVAREDVEKIKSRDPEPQFVTVEIESGMSRSKFYWGPEIIKKIAEQVNTKKPVAYLGHIDDKEDKTAFPPVHTLWLGATTVHRGGKAVAVVKGYNRQTEIRELLELGAVNSVSPRGDSTCRVMKGGYEVREFDLESIDWSRKGRSGLRAPVVSIASEMKGGKMDAAEVARLTREDIRTHAPSLYELIKQEGEGEAKVKLSEMQGDVAALQPQVEGLKEIAKKLGLGEDAKASEILEAVGAKLTEIEEIGKNVLNTWRDEIIAEKVPEKARGLVKRIVGEMAGVDFHDEEKAKAEIKTRVNDVVDKDEEIKVLISEMSPRERHSGGGAHVGHRAPERSATGEGSEGGRTGALKRRKVKVGG